MLQFVSVHVVYPYSSMDTARAWKNSRFILLDRLYFHTISSLSTASDAFAM